MKRKVLFLLCACVMLGACTNVNGGQDYSNQVPFEDSARDGGDDSETGRKTEIEGRTEENGSLADTREGQNQNEEGEAVSGEIVRLGEGHEEEIAPVKLADQYEQAAFFADRIYETNRENVLVSPLSLNVALGLAAQGASGETAKELYHYLGTERYADWVDSYMTYAEGLESDGNNNAKYSFSYKLANSIWVKKDEKLNPDYQKSVQDIFRAQAENVDFVKEADRTAQKINSWCDEHTEGLIKKMVEPDMFSPGLMAILMNSVYFESPWKKSWRTEEHEFQNLTGGSTTQEMLFDTVETYYENAYATAFAKDYYNGFQFIGILPKTEGDFSLSDLDLKSLLASASHEYDVKACMPRLNYETMTKTKNIVAILKAQGIWQAFDPKAAEFHNMVDGQDLYIDDILQKCRIELDEEGTRAAAVTAIMMRKQALAIEREKEIKEVYLDRPFAFLIYDSQNDQIVFAGKVIIANSKD